MDQRARVGSAIVGQSVVAYIIQVDGIANVQGAASLETIPVLIRHSSASILIFCVVSADAVRLFAVSVGRARAAPTRTAVVCDIPPTTTRLETTSTNSTVEFHSHLAKTAEVSSNVSIHHNPTRVKVVTPIG